MKKINLKFKSDLDDSISSKFNQIARNKIDEFHNFISKISNDNKNIFEWWMSSPSSRYTLSSPLYFNFCSVYLLIFILESDLKVDVIFVDNIQIKNLFDKIIKKHNKNIVVFTSNYRLKKLKNIFREIISIHLQFINQILRSIICKIIQTDYKKLLKQKIILIDKFIFPGYVHIERYYPGLIESINKNNNQIYFVPALFHFKLKDLWKTYNELNNSNYNYLFKERFLSFFDIFDTFLYFIKKNKIILENNQVCGFDLSDVIRNELNDNMISYAAAIESILTMKFVKNISKLNFNVKLAIDWFENQINDRGWNYGFNKYFPGIETKGYRGLIPSDLLLSEMYPTEDENRNRMLPKKICVIGTSLKDKIKKYVKDVDIEVAPAFRFKHIWEKKYLPSKDHYIIFVALPINFSDSIFILNLVLESLSDFHSKRFKIFIKPHPTITSNVIKKNLKRNIPNFYKFCEGNTQNILFKTNLLISGMSSICLEGIAIGIPLLIIENKNKLNYRTIPKDIPENLYKYCYNKKEVLFAINYFKNINQSIQKSNNIKAKKIKSDYFCPVTKYTINKFLNI